MPLNKLALIRYKTLDACLQNRYRKWTLESLIEKVNDALYEYEGITKGVSKRTIQADLQLMRSDKLGYNAPIIVVDKKYYTYEDPKFSITQTQINDADLDKMKEILEVLKHLNGFHYFDEMSEMIAKLEDSIYKSKNKGHTYIQFENNTLVKGIDFINPLYKAVKNQIPLLIRYKSFTAKAAKEAIYYPYLLKEYRNRWFLLVKNKNIKNLSIMALDRMEAVNELPKEPFVQYPNVDFEHFFDDVIGVTKTEHDKARNVILKVNKQAAPYILTKPLHASQTILKEDETGIILQIQVVLNFELEREILGFAEQVKVLAPRYLANKIKYRIGNLHKLYEE